MIDKRLRGLEQIVWWCKFLISLSQALSKISDSSKKENSFYGVVKHSPESQVTRRAYDSRHARVLELIRDSRPAQVNRDGRHPQKLITRRPFTSSPLNKVTNYDS